MQDPEFTDWAFGILSSNLLPSNWKRLEWEARRATIIEVNKLILSGKLKPWQSLSLEVGKRNLIECALVSVEAEGMVLCH